MPTLKRVRCKAARLVLGGRPWDGPVTVGIVNYALTGPGCGPYVPSEPWRPFQPAIRIVLTSVTQEPLCSPWLHMGIRQ